MYGTNHESAVSEVISVVLVVALTVILAAIVAAYVFGMIPSLPVSRTLAYTAEQPTPSQITLVYHGGPDAGSLTFSRVSVSESGGGIPTFLNSTGDASSIFGKNIGSVMTVTSSTPSGFNQKDHIVITAHFNSGQEQVVLDTYV
jgi:archaeal type IV pilus assembly protein PilA